MFTPAHVGKRAAEVEGKERNQGMGKRAAAKRGPCSRGSFGDGDDESGYQFKENIERGRERGTMEQHLGNRKRRILYIESE